MVFETLIINRNVIEGRLNINSQIVDQILFQAHIISYANQILIWNGQYYTKDDEGLSNLIETTYRALMQRFSKNIINETVNIILSRTRIDSRLINTNDNLIPFKNGYYNIAKKTLESVDFHEYFTYCFNYDFKSSNCNRFKQFLKQVLPDPTLRDRLCIFLAYSLTSSVNLQKALILYGPGGNGKSVILDVMKHLLGSLHCQIPLQMLGDRFNQIQYQNKLANIYDDLSHDALKNIGFFKMLTGSSFLEGEIKGVDERVKYKNTCKCLFSCNQFPVVRKEESIAYYSRWIIIPLLETFRGTDRENYNLVSELLAETEGIIYYLITEYLERVNELRKIDFNETKSTWLLYSDSISSFLESCVYDEKWKVSSRDLYTSYLNYCTKRKIAISDAKIFRKRLAEAGIARIDKQDSNGVYSYTYIGICYVECD